MAEKLDAAVQNLYSVFDGYILRTPEPCAHCYSEAEVARIGARLRTVPLRDLTLDDLSHFYADGLLTWGDVDDFRHLLPRLMELFASYNLGSDFEWLQGDIRELRYRLTPDIALLRFVHAEWRLWPEPEQEAVDLYFRALWPELLSRTDPELPKGNWLDTEVLASILEIARDVNPYLGAWRQLDWPGQRHLSWFIANDEMRGWANWGSYMPTVMTNWQAVRDWLDEPATRESLEDAARSTAPRAMAWEPVLALEVLDRGRKAIKYDWGSWVPDQKSIERAAELGVTLPLRKKRRLKLGRR